MESYKIPIVSVIMPVYNGEKWLHESIPSVLNQSFRDFEFLIIDDGSKDDSSNILNNYSKLDKRIRLFFNKNQGPGNSLNFGVLKSKGKYLCFIDQDDLYDSHYLERMVAAINKYNTNFVICYGNFFNDHNNIEWPIDYPYFDSGIIDITNIEQKESLLKCFIPQWTKIVKRDFVEKYQIKFGKRDNLAHDYPFHILSIYFSNKVGCIHSYLYKHRLHENQISNKLLLNKSFLFSTFHEVECYYHNHKLPNKDLIKLVFHIIDYNSLNKKYKLKFHLLQIKYFFVKTLINLFYKEKQDENYRRIFILGIRCKKIKKQDNQIKKLIRINSLNVGKHSYCANKIKIVNPKETVIGNFVSIGCNCQLGSGDHPKNYISTSPYFYYDELGFKSKNMPSHEEFWYYKGIKIDHDVWIGDNVMIKNGIHIGTGAIIGYGAVVTKDVPPYAIIAGVPARIIKYRFEKDIIEKLLESEWWYLPDEIIKKIPYDNIEQTISFLNSLKKK